MGGLKCLSHSVCGVRLPPPKKKQKKNNSLGFLCKNFIATHCQAAHRGCGKYDRNKGRTQGMYVEQHSFKPIVTVVSLSMRVSQLKPHVYYCNHGDECPLTLIKYLF